ncbi:MAG: sulfatase-like hydrolase/transferase [Candidatus Hydrogenedentes bacterium]|nr:sulfatase-like hydrolase/transferase [Candidatus Hydrogenedentota bacterium]
MFLKASAGLAAAGLTASCAPGSGGPFRRLFLVTLDTLRADHLECYGYPRDTAPFLTDLARRSALFRRAMAASSHTNPAHASIFSGLEVPQHKYVHNSQAGMSDKVYAMAQAFQDSGFDTAGFYSMVWLGWFERGFRTFQRRPDPDKYKVEYSLAPETVALARDWLRGRGPRDRFFLWLHLFDAHVPYRAPAEFRDLLRFRDDKERRQLTAYWLDTQKKDPESGPWAGDLDAFVATQQAYDAEIRFMDAHLGELYAYAGRRGLNDNSLWIVTADHGEGLGAHGYEGHGKHIYQEELHVPLLIHAPDGRYGARGVDGLAHHTDLLPTAADAFGVSVDRQATPIHGVSLMPLVDGTGGLPSDRRVFAQRRRKYPLHPFTMEWEDGPIYSVQDERLKYIFHAHGVDEFFALDSDPRELANLAVADSAEADAMRAHAQAAYAQLTADSQSIEEKDLSSEHVEALKAAGYL